MGDDVDDDAGDDKNDSDNPPSTPFQEKPLNLELFGPWYITVDTSFELTDYINLMTLFQGKCIS